MEEFSRKISIGALGGGGLIFTLVTCYSLYGYVEKIFNDIWRVGQRRTIIGKFLTFYAMVTLLPTLAGFSLYWSGRLVTAGAASRFFAPLLVQFVALVLMNKLLPRTNVNWGAAILGAMVTGFLLEAVKFAFVTYAQKIMFESYSGVYGPVGLIPLVLVWIYTSWLLVLLGAEIAHSLQNLQLLEAEDRRQRDEEPINGLLAAQLLAAVAGAHETGGAGLPKEKLATELRPDARHHRAHRRATEGARADRRGARRHQRLHPGTRRRHHHAGGRAGGRFARPTSRSRTAPPRRRCARWSRSSTRIDASASKGSPSPTSTREVRKTTPCRRQFRRKSGRSRRSRADERTQKTGKLRRDAPVVPVARLRLRRLRRHVSRQRRRRRRRLTARRGCGRRRRMTGSGGAAAGDRRGRRRGGDGGAPAAARRSRSTPARAAARSTPRSTASPSRRRRR